MIKVGILFGGKSREREISFAGGRTVYDILDKTLFEPIPIFIDSIGNFILLQWSYMYKGTIRDFYPSSEILANTNKAYKLYIDSFTDEKQIEKEINKIGRKISIEEIKTNIDIVFLALHGSYGEDGTIQGLLDFYNIPYTGTGIYGSVIGINKDLQKKILSINHFKTAWSVSIGKHELKNEGKIEQLLLAIKSKKVVIKPATQGSSIGISILENPSKELLMECLEKAFFRKRISKTYWNSLPNKIDFISELSEVYTNIGLPLKIDGETLIYNPDDLLKNLEDKFTHKEEVVLEALEGEHTVLIEEFIEGTEFSCVVIENFKTDSEPIALPPTGIIKKSDLYDYKAKYLPGISRKETPIDIDENLIVEIQKSCVSLYKILGFNVYARIDGIIKENGEIFLNDPNTTSGMLPSSFFFHQAAEIGLSPSQFLTYIIYVSIISRIKEKQNSYDLENLLNDFNALSKKKKQVEIEKQTIGVVFGGTSSERHISVESGRNVYQKLSSAGKYNCIPFFLTEEDNELIVYKLPYNLMLKDNADDIKDYLQQKKKSGSFLIDNRLKAKEILTLFGDEDYEFQPIRYTLQEFGEIVDFCFVALHGRPGEDGRLQLELEKLNIPYNGSSPQSASETIDKYITGRKLSENGILTASQLIYTKQDFIQNTFSGLGMSFPFIAKPLDDGCSSAVVKINSLSEFESYCRLLFRDTILPDITDLNNLGLNIADEIPQKDKILIESLIDKKDADIFLEITGGMLIDGENIQVFEPSETISSKSILSLAEKFLAGEGKNITPVVYALDKGVNQEINKQVKATLRKTAEIMEVDGYCRIDAFVRIYLKPELKVETIIIEINSLPGLTPATCIFHQAALENYKPFQFLEKIIENGFKRSITTT